MRFKYVLPINLIFGCGAVNEVGKLVTKHGKRALIVTGGQSTKKSGLLAKTVSLLGAEGVASVIFDKVMPNPTDTLVYEGAEIVRNEGCDVILGLGGGSSMDCAKAIAFSAYNEGNLFDYIFNKRNAENRILPVILVTTTSGTGSEGNNIGVITNSVTKDKKGLRHPELYAKASIVDPELMLTMPRNVLASVGFDTFCHNMEAYISINSQPLSDLYAYEGLHLTINNLIEAYNNPDNIEAFTNLSLANTLGGMAISVAGVCAPHAMEHPVSGLHNVTHGEGLAAVIPSIVKRLQKSPSNKLDQIARLLGGTNYTECYELINDFLHKINLKVKLSELGVKAESLDWLTDNCVNVMNLNLGSTPIKLLKSDIKEMYIESL